MKNKKSSLLLLLLFGSLYAIGQVQASKEPFHPIVFENKFIRILNVLLPPKDTSQFHIHSTPSLFVYFTNTNIRLQTQGKDWVSQRSTAGNARFTSYTPDILIHRVTNIDSDTFHVNDIEILSYYDSVNATKMAPLPFPVVLDNERSFAYQLTAGDMKAEATKARAPLVAELVTGEDVQIHYAATNQSKTIMPGKFLYIDPGTSFYFSSKDKAEVKMILFEIR